MLAEVKFTAYFYGNVTSSSVSRTRRYKIAQLKKVVSLGELAYSS